MFFSFWTYNTKSDTTVTDAVNHSGMNLYSICVYTSVIINIYFSSHMQLYTHNHMYLFYIHALLAYSRANISRPIRICTTLSVCINISIFIRICILTPIHLFAYPYAIIFPWSAFIFTRSSSLSPSRWVIFFQFVYHPQSYPLLLINQLYFMSIPLALFCNAICCTGEVQSRRTVVVANNGMESFWLGRKYCSQTIWFKLSQIFRERRWHRDNVVVLKTKGKINNDLLHTHWRIYTFIQIHEYMNCECISTCMHA